MGDPINYTDPSGHKICDGENNDDCYSVNGSYGVEYIGQDWTQYRLAAAKQAVEDVAYSEWAITKTKDPYSAFRAAMGTNKAPLKLYWGNANSAEDGVTLSGECAGITGGGCTTGPHLINFMSLSEPTTNRTCDMAFTDARNNVVHELGHAFASRWYIKGGTYDPTGPYENIPADLVGGNAGFAESPVSAHLTWRQHPCAAGDGGCSHETFADMFLGWTYNTLGTTQPFDRADFMTTNMAEWVPAASAR